MILLLISIPIIYWGGKAYLKWKKIKDIAGSIKSTEFESILKSIEEIGTEDSTAILLVPTSKLSTCKEYILTIPENFSSQWSGKSIEFNPIGNLEVDLTTNQNRQVLGLTEFKELSIPRIKLKNGKLQNVWSAQRYINFSEKLQTLLSAIPKEDQSLGLEYILGSTVRVRGGIEWVQSAEHPKCSICNGKMEFLLQVTGTWFPKTVDFDIHESTIYVFGCTKHEDNIQKVIQFG